jgi:acyl transferase domain-containing protein
LTEPSERRNSDSALRQAAVALQQMQSRLDAAEREHSEPIAIVGMACRFPGGADDPESYWRLLRNGADLVDDIPEVRWDSRELYDPDPDAPGRMYCNQGGFLRDIEHFDASFFGISAREALSLDPQQRLALEVAWEALENAGIAPKSLAGSATGVFLGICAYGYGLHTIFSGVPDRIDPYCGTGIALNVAAGRISYTFGLQGPNMPVDTACSSSLVAPHLAIQCLRTRQCDLAIAGGVNLLIAPELTVYFCKLRALSRNGRCKTFDASADGYVRGEGCGLIVLKRLSDALADGDRVVAVLRGSAINHDGRSGGLTVPNGRSQQAVIRRALANARLSAGDIDYIEAHGTGTPLGDPIEIHALGDVFGRDRAPDAPLLLGSVKTNIGHLEAAAGIAGIIKVALALNREELPPHLHFKEWNPHINLDGAPIRLTTTLTPWPKGDRKRIAGISSFGISGTNAHLILEESPTAPRQNGNGRRRHLHLLTLSARHSDTLSELAGRYDHRLGDGAPAAEDIAFTANTGRTHLNHRLAVIAADAGEIRLALRGERPLSGCTTRGSPEPGARPLIGFLFSGQGSQYPGMARRLYEEQPSFRETLQRCDSALAPELGRPLLPLMLGEAPDAEPLLNQTRFTQAALFAMEYALAELWRSWGVVPDAVLGHSVGEVTAACAAGVFSLEDGLRLIAHRGRMMGDLPAGGAMAAVRGGLNMIEQTLADCGGRAGVAAVNGPQQVVISGPQTDVEAVLRRLEAKGVWAQRLRVSHAFHSVLMDPVLDELEQAAADVRYTEPRIRLASNLTGAFVRTGEIGPGYWREHARRPVRFSTGIGALADFGCTVFLEIGPSPALLALGRDCLKDPNLTWLASLRPGKDDLRQMLETLAEVYVHGADIDWLGFHRDAPGRKVELPASPFKREHFWIPRAFTLNSNRRESGAAASTPSHPLLGSRLNLAGRETVYQAGLEPDKPVFLEDHQVHGIIVFPAAAYCEMALAASAGENRQIRISGFAVEEPLVLLKGARTTLQSIVRQDKDRQLTFEVYSLREESQQQLWKRHAVATLESAAPAPAEPGVLARLQRLCPEEVSVGSHYDRMRQHGMEYGPAFQGLAGLWRGEGQVLARVALPDCAAAGRASYRLHPALLDACLQAVGSLLVVDGGVSYLPVGLESLDLHAAVPAQAWCHGSIREQQSGGAVADFRLLDDGGSIVATVTGLRFRRATREAILGSMGQAQSGWLHDIQWQQTAQAEAAPSAEPGRWLIVAEGGDGQRLQQALEGKGETATLVRDLDGLPTASTEHVRGVVYLADRGAPQNGDPGIACADVLRQVQALAGGRAPGACLWLVTRGAQAVLPDGEPVSPWQSALWGIGRVAASEHPELRCTMADLDPAADGQEALLVEWLLSDSYGDQLAFREGLTYAARLVGQTAAARGPLEAPEGQPFRLEPQPGGLLDGLHLVPTPSRDPRRNELKMQVRATGLNFRDVLNVLGMYPGPAGPLGGECAGTVIAAGADAGFQPGDRVVAIAPGSFASEVVIPSELASGIPAGLSFEEAATLPVAFLTASYALHHLGRMQRGEKVLIHSAAGGVGNAAIQLALRAGTEIFATAGSDRKRRWLHSLGVTHVMDSRSLAFRDQVLEATGGKGVDLVLNSLAGEFIPASLSVLAPGGRFLEIGKAELWSEDRLQAEYPGIEYHTVALDDLSAENPSVVQTMLRALMADIEAGELHPLPLRTFPLVECTDAFRFMQRAQHIGKIVLTQQDGAALLRPQATYLITGGTGALGLLVARHFGERGARSLALMARNEPSAEASHAIAELGKCGIKVTVLRGDVANREDVASILAHIRREMPPLRGILHAAGVLDDATLVRQTKEQFQRVLAPKAQGAWNLHELTMNEPLDFFVLFSSAAAALGSPGQANYAAANSFLDGLAHFRRAHGLPAAAIDWGPWQAGMASTGAGRRTDWSAMGMRPIEPEEGLALLDRVICGGPPQIVAIPVDWDAFLSQIPAGAAPPPLLRGLKKRRRRESYHVDGTEEFLQRLKLAPEGERLRLAQEEIERHAAAILGFDHSNRIDPKEPLHDLGFDSLMAVELRNALAAYVHDDLPATLAFDYPTLESLAEFLLAEVMAAEEAEPGDVLRASASGGETATRADRGGA